MHDGHRSALRSAGRLGGRRNASRGGAAAATVFEAPEATRPLLALSDQVAVGRASRGRRVLLEQPLGSGVYDQSEMERTRELIKDGVLLERKPRGRQLG